MIRSLPKDYINGKLVRIDSSCYLSTKKTSRYRILNWIYRIIFGFEKKYNIEDGECIVFNGTIIMNPNTYNSLKENVENMTLTEWLDKENSTTNKGNIFAPPMDGQVAVNFLCDYLLGEDWYSANPVSQKQINTEIVCAILEKYSRKYRKELRKRR